MYLLDSDVARKLCQYGLLDEFLLAFECGLQDIGILPQLKFQLQLQSDQKAASKLGSVHAVNQARRLVRGAVEIEITSYGANPILELRRPDLDAGELALIAFLFETQSSTLVTGDKRALRVLSGIPIIDNLWRKFICIEHALLRIIQSADFSAVSQKIRANPQVDNALTIAFGVTIPTSLHDATTALTSYIRSLRTETGGKYVPS